MSELHKFLFEGLPVRGMLVRLTEGWREALRRQQGSDDSLPTPVRALLGEMAAAGVLMQSNIKFNGALVLQISGDGPVKLAVVEVQPDLAFRATATVAGAVPRDARLQALLNVHGQGRCAITLDPKDKLPGQQPYQGIVPLHGDAREPLQELSQVLEHYMLQSEQLDTRLVLAADDEMAAGVLIQRLPVEGAGNLEGQRNEDSIGGAPPGRPQGARAPSGGRREASWGPDRSEDFNRIAHLLSTLQRDELLGLDAQTILRRLFWEEKLRLFEAGAGAPVPHFACSCSRTRVARMLKGLGRTEIEGILDEQGKVEIGCEFCGLKYHFDAVDVGELFTPTRDQPPGSLAVN